MVPTKLCFLFFFLKQTNRIKSMFESFSTGATDQPLPPTDQPASARKRLGASAPRLPRGSGREALEAKQRRAEGAREDVPGGPGRRRRPGGGGRGGGPGAEDRFLRWKMDGLWVGAKVALCVCVSLCLCVCVCVCFCFLLGFRNFRLPLFVIPINSVCGKVAVGPMRMSLECWI